jgi:hypothetical protein
LLKLQCDRTLADRPEDYGAPSRSGKLLVTDQIMTMWREQVSFAQLVAEHITR